MRYRFVKMKRPEAIHEHACANVDVDTFAYTLVYLHKLMYKGTYARAKIFIYSLLTFFRLFKD